MERPNKTTALPASLVPRGLSRLDAAAYVGIGPTLFDRAVKDKKLPGPFRLYGRVLWCRRKLDAAIDALVGEDEPDAANNRLKRLRTIFAWAIKKRKLTGVMENPAVGVERLRPHRVGGFPVWTAADVEKFEARHPIGSKARLALGILLYTGVRRSDLVRLGRQHVRNGEITFRPHKGRRRSAQTITLPILPDLQRMLDAGPTGALTFLVTEYGRPFSDAGFTNWFRRRCNEAGLPNLSAHGLRKEAATRMADAGASTHQLQAVFGWMTLEQAENYTRGANNKRLASAGAQLLARNETG
jgi:integrase